MCTWQWVYVVVGFVQVVVAISEKGNLATSQPVPASIKPLPLSVPVAPQPLPLAAPVAAVTTTRASIVPADGQCISIAEDQCPTLDAKCRCKRIDAQSLICCHFSASFTLTEGIHCDSANVTKIQIWNATLTDLAIESLSDLGLEALTISASRIDIVAAMPQLPTLSCLNLSDNVVPDLRENAFQNLSSLEFLGLANLNLTILPELYKYPLKNMTLDLAGKLNLECSVLLKYVKDNPSLNFVNEDSTFCSSPKIFHWFNSTESIPLAQIQILRNIQESCTPGCTCKAHSLDILRGHQPQVTAMVDCSNLGLVTLPAELPPNTIALNVSFNNITSLDLLVSDPNYQRIRELYADSNYISSILALEGSNFIDNFLVLSLRDNRIKSLPTYILSNTFHRNYQHRTVKLGLNHFSCNCSVAQILKLWLLGNKKHIPDYNEIFCDNLRINERVVDLDVNTVCVYERDWTDYIYYIIAGEVFLLLILISKVSYDYWVFKTAGYLPWPASKMPKLPCDWVFE